MPCAMLTDIDLKGITRPGLDAIGCYKSSKTRLFDHIEKKKKKKKLLVTLFIILTKTLLGRLDNCTSILSTECSGQRFITHSITVTS